MMSAAQEEKKIKKPNEPEKGKKGKDKGSFAKPKETERTLRLPYVLRFTLVSPYLSDSLALATTDKAGITSILTDFP